MPDYFCVPVVALRCSSVEAVIADTNTALESVQPRRVVNDNAKPISVIAERTVPEFSVLKDNTVTDCAVPHISLTK